MLPAETVVDRQPEEAWLRARVLRTEVGDADREGETIGERVVEAEQHAAADAVVTVEQRAIGQPMVRVVDRLIDDADHADAGGRHPRLREYGRGSRCAEREERERAAFAQRPRRIRRVGSTVLDGALLSAREHRRWRRGTRGVLIGPLSTRWYSFLACASSRAGHVVGDRDDHGRAGALNPATHGRAVGKVGQDEIPAALTQRLFELARIRDTTSDDSRPCGCVSSDTSLERLRQRGRGVEVDEDRARPDGPDLRAGSACRGWRRGTCRRRRATRADAMP